MTAVLGPRTRLGVVGLFNVSEGWEALQRIVVAMIVALWFGGILAMGYLARLVSNPWIRVAVLLAGPFIGISALVLQAQASGRLLAPSPVRRADRGSRCRRDR